jgi:hypothetical protein
MNKKRRKAIKTLPKYNLSWIPYTQENRRK